MHDRLMQFRLLAGQTIQHNIGVEAIHDGDDFFHGKPGLTVGTGLDKHIDVPSAVVAVAGKRVSLGGDDALAFVIANGLRRHAHKSRYFANFVAARVTHCQSYNIVRGRMHVGIPMVLLPTRQGISLPTGKCSNNQSRSVIEGKIACLGFRQRSAVPLPRNLPIKPEAQACIE